MILEKEARVKGLLRGEIEAVSTTDYRMKKKYALLNDNTE
jgi:hypothetical protein